MQDNGAKAMVSRRAFLAAGSAALSAVSLTGTLEGQMTQAKTESWGRILNGRVAVVTGAARGIGRSAAVALAHSGANVVGIDICSVVDPRSGVEPATRAELDQTGDMVKSEGVQWRSFVLDQRDLPSLRRAAENINTEFGRIDILFANAGIQAFRPLLEMEDPDWHIQIDVNLTGTANALRAFAPRLRALHGEAGAWTNHHDDVNTGPPWHPQRFCLF